MKEGTKSPANISGVRTIRNQYEAKANGNFDFLNTKLSSSIDPLPLLHFSELIFT